MDANKVWQWRIMHVKKYSRCPQPFYRSNRIGLDFNVASSTQKKIHLPLVTNAVMLEVCDFAKTVNKGKRHFLTNILENNFDLGLENEQQRIDFTTQIHYKVKELIRKPPEDRSEVFTLFDTSKPECNCNNGLTKASTERKTERFPMEMDDTVNKQEDEFKCLQETSKESIKAESLSEEVDYTDDSEQEDDFIFSQERQSAEDLKDDFLISAFPYCKEIGLNFDVGSKQRLDPDLLTKGVMLELEHVTRILTASFSPIVLGVLEHNLDVDLKSQRRRNRIWFKISQLLRRSNRLAAPGRKISPEFKNEPSSLQTNPFKSTDGLTSSNMEALQYHLKEVTKTRQSELKSKQKQRALLRTSESENKRHKIGHFEDIETDSLCHHTNLCTSGKAQGDNCHTFPMGESNGDSDEVTNPINIGSQNHLQSPKRFSLCSDIARKSESSYLGFCAPLPSPTDMSSNVPMITSSVNPPFASQPGEGGLCEGEEQTQTPSNTPDKCDFGENTETEIMWKLRANRVEQILSSPNKEFYSFFRSKKAGLEYNVGFGPKQYIRFESVSSFLLIDIAKFALAMNSSQQDFIMEILEYNFDFGLLGQQQRNLFTCEIMNRVRKLQHCEDAVKFSKEVFQLPDPMSFINMANQSLGSVNPELSSTSRNECDVAPVCPSHSHPETKDHNLQKIVDLYPFCKEMDLKLHINNCQPNKKLNINKLTNGAMTEVIYFAEKLCGTFEQTCLDIVRHNFDCDLHIKDSDLARNIVALIPAVLEQNNLSCKLYHDRKIKHTGKDPSTMVKLRYQDSPNLESCIDAPLEVAITDQNEDSSADLEQQDERSLALWKLRVNHIQQILSIPHEEHCPFYSYSRCKKLGIDFNVGSGVKQNLHPKLLTNGIMVELNTFSTALLSSQRYFITEILEYNFNLNFNSELHRSSFATKTWEFVTSKINYKRYSVTRPKKVFKLPDLGHIQESTRYCARCYQFRNHKLCQDESDSDMHHPQPPTMTGMTGTVSADATCTAQKLAKYLSSTHSSTEETIMDSYPCCKKIGLNLCVDKDQPKDKIGLHLLTYEIMDEVVSFAKKLCGTRFKIINDVLDHNFKICMRRRNVDPAMVFLQVAKKNAVNLAWLNEVYSIQPVPHKQLRYATDVPQATSLRRSKLKEAFTKRKLALQTKKRATEQKEMGIESNYTCPLESDLDSSDISDSEGEDQEPTPRNVPNKCDMGQDQVGTENNLWKLRANRVKQILSSPNKEFGPFWWSKKFGLEFNVGFGPKKNISVDSLRSFVLIEIAKFALAMNSSQQDFIMEILEYNFDFGMQSQHQRNLITCEIMDRVQKLKDCEDAVKFSKQVFQLSDRMPSINMTNQSLGSVHLEIGSAPRMAKGDVGPVCCSDSHAETKDHMLKTTVDLYPFCKEIGLKLQVNEHHQNKTLDINTLTNGAMTEVINFAEKLCGTFEQICLDILRHNLDLDLQSDNPDLASSIVAQIPAVTGQRHLSLWVKTHQKIKGTGKAKPKEDCQNHQALNTCSVQSSQAAVMDEHQNKLNLFLWKLRANLIQQILSIPHEECCQLYCYSRCKKLGIDFNVASGVKQNLDPKLLTNGIMVELNTFATELLSAQKYFIAEILEYNFHLGLRNELYHTAFAQQIFDKVRMLEHIRNRALQMNMQFELPDIQEPTHDRLTYCPKCYQDRNEKVCQDESDSGQMHRAGPHNVTDTVTSDATCAEQKPPIAFSAIEKTIMDSYPRCKEIGLNLCVNKDQPKDKLDLHLLTYGIMVEVADFAKKLCPSKNMTICAFIEHNFNICLQNLDVAVSQLLCREVACKDDGPAWFNEVFDTQPFSHRQPDHASKSNEAAAMLISERKETIKKRQLALKTKKEQATLPSHRTSGVSSKTKKQNKGNLFPICAEIGLDLDLTSKSGEKEKLDLSLLTRAVVLEIYKFASKKMGHYLPHTVFDILDYNFDLSSQHHRHWEFSIATSSKVQIMVKQHQKNRNRPHEVFKLPFVLPPKRQNKNSNKRSQEKQGKKTNKGSLAQKSQHSDVNPVQSPNDDKTEKGAEVHEEDTKLPTDPGSMMSVRGGLVNAGCDKPLQENIQIKEEEYDPHYSDMKPEPDTEEKYHPHDDIIKTESTTEDVKHVVTGQPTEPLASTPVMLFPNPVGLQTGLQSQNVLYHILTEPGSAVYPSTASNITGLNTGGVKYLIPVQAVTYPTITTVQLVKKEQEHVPADSHQSGAHC
ncbi:uncharacterized protein LOC121955430 [Plectropomus leopardus]|uniref:uncharacterized protein LOC121955430 n=1 Tax=Plectropomus leopardus TaxID=160734 RepID=UPI001C4B6305|nr:uncharacterized protein LOC121955430 [Plectropomus leopardus]